MTIDQHTGARPQNVDDILQHAVDEAVRLLHADGAIIDLLESDDGRLRWTHEAGHAAGGDQRWLHGIELRVGEGLFGRAVTSREVLATDDYLGDTSFTHTADSDEFAREMGIRSVVVAPLLVDGTALGALGAYSTRPVAFGEGARGLVRALADHAAAAITNARLIHELTRSQNDLARRIEALRALREIAARITAVRDGAPILQSVVDEAKRLLCSDGAHLTLMSDDADHLVPEVIADDDDPATREWLRGMRFPLDGGLNGLAASQGRVAWTSDYMSDPRVPHEPDDDEIARRLGLRAVAVAPLRAPEGAVIGTLAVSYREPRRSLAEDEIELLQGLADHASIAVSNIQLYDRLRASELRYRYLVEHSPDLVWSHDTDGRITFVSDVSEKLVGWRPDEVIGRHFLELIHPDSRDEAARRHAAALRSRPGEMPPELSEPFRCYLLHRDGRPVAVELRGASIYQDGVFVGAHGSARDVSERDRLEEDLRRQAAEVAAGEERALLARELHDSVTQALFSMTLTTRAAELLLQRDPAAAAAKLGELRELQRDALAETRALIFELRPGSLEEDGLVPALRRHAAAVQGRTGLSVILDLEEVERLPPAHEGALYRIAQEALHNVVKHAGAQQVRITLRREPSKVRLTVHDDGSGFDQSRVTGDGLGLAGMRTRAERAGGRLQVASAPGRGTRVEAVVPLPAAPAVSATLAAPSGVVP